jgi:hypothetical protein
MADIKQFKAVTNIPAAVKKAKGDYAKVVGAALMVAPGQALAFEIEGDNKAAATKVAGLRGYMTRRNITEHFTVARQGNTIYVKYEGKRDKEGNALPIVVEAADFSDVKVETTPAPKEKPAE